MIPLDDWLVLDKEETKRESNILIPDSVKDKTIVEVGDIFVARIIGEGAKERIKPGDRCLFYGMGSVTGLKLPSGKKIWVGKAADVIFILEKGE